MASEASKSYPRNGFIMSSTMKQKSQVNERDVLTQMERLIFGDG